MLFHPTFLMVFFLSILLMIKKQDKLFKCIALASPVIVSISFMLAQGEYSFTFYSLRLMWSFSEHNKFIGLAFLIVLLSSNIYALQQKKYYELIFGYSYGGSLFISLLAKDFISMFVGLELMMCISSVIIFIGNMPKSIISAKQYFLVHFISGTMIIIGIAYILSKTHSTEIVVITNLFNNPGYSSLILYIMFIGMVINIAAFPFSGWMVNYYKEASPSGSLYLINFTTKLSVILLIKNFIGFDLLKYIAYIMLLYAGFKAVIEDNIFALLCYLSMTSMGIIVIATALGNEVSLFTVFDYLFIHIIYKSLLCIVSATLRDNLGITLCSELSGFKNRIFSVCTAIGISLMINMPFSMSFYNKISLLRSFHNKHNYIVVLLASIVTIISIPWKKFITSSEAVDLKINFYNKISILIISAVAVFIGFIWVFIPFSFTFLLISQATSYFDDIIKQLIIFILSLTIIFNLKINKKEGKSFNILTELSKIFCYFYRPWKQNDIKKLTKKQWQLNFLEKKVLKKLHVFYNQEGAILTLIFLLIIIIYTLIFNFH